jgi:hypothetical protein
VTLYIGNSNPKGRAAVEALLRGLGRPIQAPQGILQGFRDREVVPLPEPFGPRGVFNFNSPEYDLFPALLGVTAVTVKVGFELRLATYALALLAVLPGRHGRRSAAILETLSRPLLPFGCSGGAVMTELFFADGSMRRAVLWGRQDGQRMAALPCAFVAEALCRGELPVKGARTAYEFLGATALLEQLRAAGFELSCTHR